MNIGTRGPSKRIEEFDGLRGIAILFVLGWHYFYFYPAAGYHPAGALRSLYVYFERSIAVGWSGVDLFFILSGFLIGGILLDAKGLPEYFKVFYTRRFYRIIPIYYAWIMGYIAIVVLLRSVPAWNSYASDEPGLWPILSHFLFIQNLGFVRYSGIAIAWFTATWSLAVEEQFYLIAPVVIRVFSRRTLPPLLCSVVIAAPLIRLYVHYHWHPATNLDPAYILMPCRADGLATGMLSAYLWRREAFRTLLSKHFRVLYGLCGIFLAGVACLTFLSADQHSIAMISVGYTWFAFFYALILLLVLVHPAGPVGAITRVKFLRYLGRVSYCVYIIHQAVLYFVSKEILWLDAPSSGLRTAIARFVAIGVTLWIADLSWKYLEGKMIARGHSYRYPAAQPAPTP